MGQIDAVKTPHRTDGGARGGAGWGVDTPGDSARYRPGMVLRGAVDALRLVTEPELMLVGPRRTAKSWGHLWCSLMMMQQYPGSRHLLLRATRSSMTETTLPSLEEMLATYLSPAHPELRRQARTQRHSYTLFGSELVCGSLDEPERLRGGEWDRITVEEATEITEDQWESLVPLLGGRRVPVRQRLAVTNPGARGHFLNHRFPQPPASVVTGGERMTHEQYLALWRWNVGPQRGKRRRLVSVFQDNPRWWSFDPWGWTAEGRRFIVGGIGGITVPHERARFFEGRWATAEGSVFPSFSRERHVFRPFTVPGHWPGFVGYDPGFDHPSALAVAVVGANGRIYIVAERVASHLTLPQIATWLTEYEKACGFVVRKKLGDPHYIATRTAHSSGDTIQYQMQRLGHRFELAPAASNGADLDAQVQQMRALLDRTLGDGRPALMVSEACQSIIAAFESWRFKRSAKGEITGTTDRYEEPYKDEMDAVRMIVAGRPGFAVPQALVVEQV